MAALTTALIAGAAVAGAGASAYSGNRAASAAKKAGSEQAAAAQQAANRSAAQGEQMRSDLAPYREVGTEALDMYRNMVLGGDMSSFQASPGYQFRLGEGINAMDKTAAARGGLLSGAQLKGVQNYAQGLASDEYQQYANRLQNLAQQGQNAATQTGVQGFQSTQAQNLASQNAAQAYGQGMLGQAQGYGQMASGITGALGQGLGMYAGYKSLGGGYGGGSGSYGGAGLGSTNAANNFSSGLTLNTGRY